MRLRGVNTLPKFTQLRGGERRVSFSGLSFCWEAGKDAKAPEATENLKFTDFKNKMEGEQLVFKPERLPN